MTPTAMSAQLRSCSGRFNLRTHQACPKRGRSGPCGNCPEVEPGNRSAKLIAVGAIFLTPGIVLVLLAYRRLTALGLSQPLAYLVSDLAP